MLFVKTNTYGNTKQSTPNDTAQVNRLNLKAWELRNNNIEKAKSLALEALQLADELNYSLGSSYSYNILGHYYKVKGGFDSALTCYNQSLLIRQQLKDTLNIIRSMRNVMSIYKLTGDNTDGISIGLKAIDIAQKNSVKNKPLLNEKAWLQVNVSAIYLNIGNTAGALQYALAGKETFTTTANNDGIGAALLTLGNIYESERNYKQALEYYKAAEKIAAEENNSRELAKTYNNIGNIYYHTNNEEEALHYYTKSTQLRDEKGFDNDAAGSLFNVGAIYENRGDLNKAEEYYTKSLAQYMQAGDAKGKLEANYALGNILLQNKRYAPAIIHFNEAFLLAESSGLIVEKIDVCEKLATTYKRLTNTDSALHYLELATALKDSTNLQTHLFFELDASIKAKQQELLLTKANNKTQFYIIIFLSVTVILAITLAYFIFKKNKAKRTELELKNKISEYELTTMDALMEGQENERQRLAIELHDTIGSILSATKYAFKSFENSLEKILNNSNDQYIRINAMLDEALENVRKISHDMASGILKDVGLRGALEKLCETISSSGGLEISLHVYGFDEEIESSSAMHLYRMVQELLTNVLKHAQAHNVTIQVIKTIDNVNLTVEDDGKGFNRAEIREKKGIGLENIDKRVKMLNGTWDVDSGKGKGTTIIIDIPISENPIL